jgi:DNA-binding transcriptional regulator YiaG
MSKRAAKTRVRKKIVTPRTTNLVSRAALTKKRTAAVAVGSEGKAPSIAELRCAFGLSREKFSRLTGFSLRSLAAWESGAQPGEVARVRFMELDRLRAGLARAIRSTAIHHWLDTPNPAFGGLKPLEAVERGEIDRLWRMIFELESGVAG